MISYHRMNNGRWGVRGPSKELQLSQPNVMVRKKDRTMHAETITRIVYDTNGMTLAEIQGSTPVGSSHGT